MSFSWCNTLQCAKTHKNEKEISQCRLLVKAQETIRLFSFVKSRAWSFETWLKQFLFLFAFILSFLRQSKVHSIGEFWVIYFDFFFVIVIFVVKIYQSYYTDRKKKKKQQWVIK